MFRVEVCNPKNQEPNAVSVAKVEKAFTLPPL
jgi:hypothetical protein